MRVVHPGRSGKNSSGEQVGIHTLEAARNGCGGEERERTSKHLDTLLGRVKGDGRLLPMECM